MITSPSDLDPPVFLVGCPRSGTTLLQTMLAAHPRIFSVPETHFFAKLVSKRPLWRKLGLTERRREAWCYLVHTQPDFLDGEKIVRTLFVSSHTGLFKARMDRLAAEQGARCWLEKTPRHLHYIADIERYFSGARFIHILRNGKDAIASLVDVTRRYPDQWGGARSIDKVTRRWITDVEMSLAHVHRANHHLCLYEDLIDDPQAVLSAITAFLGIYYHPAMLDDRGRAYEGIGEKGAEWTRAATQSIGPTQQRFEKLFDADEQTQIARCLETSGFATLVALKDRLRAASS